MPSLPWDLADLHEPPMGYFCPTCGRFWTNPFDDPERHDDINYILFRYGGHALCPECK